MHVVRGPGNTKGVGQLKNMVHIMNHSKQTWGIYWGEIKLYIVVGYRGSESTHSKKTRKLNSNF